MNKKLITTGLIVGTLALTSVSFAAFGGNRMSGHMWSMNDAATIQAAVAANNYASLSTQEQAKISTTQFADMVTKYNARKAVQDAITAGDYTAFKNALIAQLPDEATFQKMVANEKARTDAQAQILVAVQNNDFTAYKTALATQKAAIDANNGTSTTAKTPKAPTDKQLQKQFTKLVTYYKANGKLPAKLGGPGYGDDNSPHPMPQFSLGN